MNSKLELGSKRYYSNMKLFKDFMYHNYMGYYRLAVQTSDYMYDRESFEGELHKACMELISFYNVNFCKKRLYLPELPKTAINYELMAILHNKALPVINYYWYAFKSGRGGKDHLAGDFMYGDAWGYLNKINNEINVILGYPRNFEGEIVYGKQYE